MNMKNRKYKILFFNNPKGSIKEIDFSKGLIFSLLSVLFVANFILFNFLAEDYAIWKGNTDIQDHKKNNEILATSIYDSENKISNIEEKLKTTRVFSFQKRLFDFAQPLFIAAAHPLTGIGLDLDQFQKFRYEFYMDSESLELINETLGVSLKGAGTSAGSANSLTFLLAAMGFPTAFLFVFMFLRQKIIDNHRLLFFFIVFASVMSEPLFLRPCFFIFIISGFYNFFLKFTSNRIEIL